MMRTAVIAGSALLAGLCLGFFLGLSQRQDTPSTQTNIPFDQPLVSEHTNHPGTRSAEAPAEPEPESPDPDTSLEDEPAPDSPDSREAFEALRHALTGTFELRGKAVYADGRAASGVELLAKIDAYTTQAAAKKYGLESELEHECVTQEDGSFVLTGLPRQYLSIRCKDPSLRASNLSSTSLMPGSGAYALLMIRPTVPVEITVLDPHGHEPPLASITARVEGLSSGNVTTVWTPDDRTIHMVPGKLLVRASSPTDPEYLDSVELELKAGKPASITLQFKKKAGLYLELVTPYPWYETVEYFLLTAGDAAAFKADAASRRTSNGVEKGVLGSHRLLFPDLAAGEYVFIVVANYGFEVQRLPINFEGGTREMTLELASLQPADHLLLRVCAPGGEVCMNSEIQIWRMHNGRTVTALGARALDQDGTWWILPRTDAEGLETLGASVSVPGLGKLETDVHVTRGVVQDLYLVESGTVDVRVSGLNAELVNRLELLLYPAGAERPIRFGGGARYDGTSFRYHPRIAEETRFADVPTGEAELVVNLSLESDYFRAGPEVLRQAVRVGTEGNEFEINLPPFYELTVKFPADHAARRLGMVAPTPSTRDIEDGKATWLVLPAGDYRLNDFQTGDMTVKVGGNTEIDWRPRVFSCIHITRLDRDGVLEDAGFQPGDVITSINGIACEGYEPLKEALTNARKEETVRLEVSRAEQTLVIQIEGSKLDTGLRHAAFRYESR